MLGRGFLVIDGDVQKLLKLMIWRQGIQAKLDLILLFLEKYVWIKDHFFVWLSFVPALVAVKKNQCRAKRLFWSNCQGSRMKRNYNPRLSARRTRKPNWPPGVITGEEDISGEGR